MTEHFVVKISVEFPEKTSVDDVLAVCQFFDDKYIYPAADVERIRYCKNRFGEVLNLFNEAANPPNVEPVSFHLTYFIKSKQKENPCQKMTVKQLRLLK